jgi:hypothetical protein
MGPFEIKSCKPSPLKVIVNRVVSQTPAVNQEVVGTLVPLTLPLFACDILRRLLLRVSLEKSTSAPLRF